MDGSANLKLPSIAKTNGKYSANSFYSVEDVVVKRGVDLSNFFQVKLALKKLGKTTYTPGIKGKLRLEVLIERLNQAWQEQDEERQIEQDKEDSRIYYEKLQKEKIARAEEEKQRQRNEFKNLENNAKDAIIRDDFTAFLKCVAKGVNPNLETDIGSTALIRATFSGNLDVIRRLIEKGAKVDKVSTFGITALLEACLTSNLEVVKLLTQDFDAKINLELPDGRTYLIAMVKLRRVEVAEFLIDKCGADVNYQNKEGRTALMECVCEKGVERINSCKLLLNRNANINLRDNDHNDAISLARRAGNISAARLMEQQKFDIRMKNECFKRQLNSVLEKQAQARAELKQLDENRKNMDIAIGSLNIKNIKSNIDSGLASIDHEAPWGDTPLLVAVRLGTMTDIFELLWKYGADPNYQNKHGATPLMNAAHFGKIKVVRFLIEERVKLKTQVEAKNNEGWTALMIAANRGHSEIVKTLLKVGKSQVSYKNERGMDAIMVAEAYGDHKTIKVLKKAIKSQRVLHNLDNDYGVYETEGYYSSDSDASLEEWIDDAVREIEDEFLPKLSRQFKVIQNEPALEPRKRTLQAQVHKKETSPIIQSATECILPQSQERHTLHEQPPPKKCNGINNQIESTGTSINRMRQIIDSAKLRKDIDQGLKIKNRHKTLKDRIDDERLRKADEAKEKVEESLKTRQHLHWDPFDETEEKIEELFTDKMTSSDLLKRPRKVKLAAHLLKSSKPGDSKQIKEIIILLEETLEEQIVALGKEDLHLVPSYRVLAATYMKQQDEYKSLFYLRKAVHICELREDIGGYNYRKVTADMYDTLIQTEHYLAAENFQKSVIKRLKAGLGGSHRVTIEAKEKLASYHDTLRRKSILNLKKKQDRKESVKTKSALMTYIFSFECFTHLTASDQGWTLFKQYLCKKERVYFAEFCEKVQQFQQQIAGSPKFLACSRELYDEFIRTNILGCIPVLVRNTINQELQDPRPNLFDDALKIVLSHIFDFMYLPFLKDQKWKKHAGFQFAVDQGVKRLPKYMAYWKIVRIQRWWKPIFVRLRKRKMNLERASTLNSGN